MIRFIGWGKLLTRDSPLAYTFSVVAWEEWDRPGGRVVRHGGVPPTPQQAKGVKVLVTNPDDEGDTHQFWAFNTSPKNAFQDFAEWWVLIGGLMVMHGMELADEGPGGGGGPGPPDDEDWDEEEEEEEPKPKRPRIFQRIGRAFRRIFRR